MLTIRLAGFLLLATIGLLGCASGDDPGAFQKEPEMLCAPTQEVRDLYATARTVIGMHMAAEEQAIKNKKLTAVELDAIRKKHEDLRALDFDLKRKIENPKSTLDVQKILRVLEALGKIVGAAT